MYITILKRYKPLYTIINQEKSQRFILTSRAKDTTDILILQRFDKNDLIRLKRLTRTYISIWPGARPPRPAQSASKTQTASDFF